MEGRNNGMKQTYHTHTWKNGLLAFVMLKEELIR